MKILLAIASLLLTACTRPRAPTVGTYDARPGAPTVAIRAVTVVDVMDGSLLPEQTVLIAGNRIVAVGTTDEVRIPRDAELVEAAGRYLIPGLWDMHVHSVTVPWRSDTANPSIAPQDWHLPLFLAYGVTGVRNMNDAHRRRDARADEHDQAPVGGGKPSRPTPIPQRRPCESMAILT